MSTVVFTPQNWFWIFLRSQQLTEEALRTAAARGKPMAMVDVP